MSFPMALRGFFLCLGALAALSGTAFAGKGDYPPPPMPEDDGYYSGPPILRHIPGIRILFGDYALTEDEFNALYGQKKHRRFDESYYVPEPDPAPPRRVVKPKPPASTAATAPKSTTGTATTTAKPAPQKTASAAAGPLTCEKATAVVSGYGFSSVEASSCTGKVYAFNARRDGKAFAIKLDPASGELTEVKKLP